MEAKTRNILIIVVIGLILLGVVGYFIYKSIPASSGGGAPPVTTTNTNPGFLDQGLSILCKTFPKLCGGGENGIETDACAGVLCDSNKYGWDVDGFPNNCCA